jgi:hypothetical protein
MIISVNQPGTQCYFRFISINIKFFLINRSDFFLPYSSWRVKRNTQQGSLGTWRWQPHLQTRPWKNENLPCWIYNLHVILKYREANKILYHCVLPHISLSVLLLQHGVCCMFVLPGVFKGFRKEKSYCHGCLYDYLAYSCAIYPSQTLSLSFANANIL